MPSGASQPSLSPIQRLCAEGSQARARSFLHQPYPLKNQGIKGLYWNPEIKEKLPTGALESQEQNHRHGTARQEEDRVPLHGECDHEPEREVQATDEPCPTEPFGCQGTRASEAHRQHENLQVPRSPLRP